MTAIRCDCRRDFGSGGDFLLGGSCAADAIFPPVRMRFQIYAVELDPAPAAHSEAVRSTDAVRGWSQAAAEEPWVIERYAV